MYLTRNPIVRTAGAALIAVLLTAVPAFAARGVGGGYRGGYRGGWSGYRGGWGGYRGGLGWGLGGFGLGYALGSWSSPYYGYGYGSPYYSTYYAPTYGSAYYTPTYDYSTYSPTYGAYYTPAYGYSTPSYVTTPSTTVIATPDVSTAQASYYTPAQPDNRAHIEVRVPPDAQVMFDGAPTQQTGENRVFVSPPLDPGQNYSYDITARWMENGKMVDQTKTVKVTAGASTMVDFSR